MKKIIALIIIILFALAIIHNVPKKITDEDKIYLLKLIPNLKVYDIDYLSFEEEIDIIQNIQHTLLNSIELGEPIPYYQQREPKDLYKNQTALCYDFSRTIEKALQYSGFKTRHLSIYANRPNYQKHPLFDKNSFSHATTEVLTSNGWMIVDSNSPWIALDRENKTYSLVSYQKTAYTVEWLNEMPIGYDFYYNKNCTYVYGLYSRHGKFYKPYNFMPDYNMRELLYNFF